MINLTVIIASSGRPSLTRTIESAQSQMVEGDELLISINRDAPWGHKARNYMMRAARTDVILFQDDDDVYVPGAFEVIRAHFKNNPYLPHMFRMRYADGSQLWQTTDVACGNVSTQMIAVPNRQGLLGVWDEEKYEGDYYFISSTVQKFGSMLWVPQVITSVRPT